MKSSNTNKRPRDPRAALITARVIPVFLVLVAVYCSYVMIGPLSINYLLNPPEGEPLRDVAGIAIPIFYFLLLFPVAASWLRLTLVVLTEPGYIPQGPKRPKPGVPDTQPPPGLEAFWMRDAFVCDKDGMPIWCSFCHAWKPDRTHHNQDVGRCTRKMDHFCPWVGGVVGENSMKFFIQFVGYTSLLTAYVMITLAYFVANHQKDPQWCVALGLSAFFLMFTLGMFLNSVYLAAMNVTTVEHMGIGGARQTFIAVVLPPEQQQVDPITLPSPTRRPSPPSDAESQQPPNSELDDPAHQSYFQKSARPPRRTSPPSSPTNSQPQPSKNWKGTITFPLNLPTDRPPIPAPSPRTFAILALPARMTPWDLKSPWSNLSEVFGSQPDEWFLPIKRSPCCDHTSMIAEYPLGPDFEALLEKVGLVRKNSKLQQQQQQTALGSGGGGGSSAGSFSKDAHAQSSVGDRRRKRVLDAGWQNGERPDGWMLEKEARRARKSDRRRDAETMV
jgi:palmitoyltransferase